MDENDDADMRFIMPELRLHHTSLRCGFGPDIERKHWVAFDLLGIRHEQISIYLDHDKIGHYDCAQTGNYNLEFELPEFMVAIVRERLNDSDPSRKLMMLRLGIDFRDRVVLLHQEAVRLFRAEAAAGRG